MSSWTQKIQYTKPGPLQAEKPQLRSTSRKTPATKAQAKLENQDCKSLSRKTRYTKAQAKLENQDC